MIVFCEECGAKNIIDPEKIQGDKVDARCKNCKDVLRVYDMRAVQAVKDAAASPFLINLELKFKEKSIRINQARPHVTMGRQEHNDLEVTDNRVSRSHAYIEYRDGNFFLMDQSTNGTFVLMEGQPGVSLKRKEHELIGAGVIGLGRKVDFSSPDAIHFAIKN